MEAESKFDFDYWAKLAGSDPKAFEKERKRTIEAAIAKMSEHLREGTRFILQEADRECARDKNPLSICFLTSRIMLESLKRQMTIWAYLYPPPLKKKVE